MRTGSRPYRYAAYNAPARFAAYSQSAGAPGQLLGMHAAMRRYLEHRGAIGSAESTRVLLETYIRDFMDWAEPRGLSHPQQVSRAVLERYQRYLFHYRKKNGEPLSFESQRGKLTALRGWFKWLTRQGEIPANPAADLDLPRKIHRLPRQVLSLAEAEQVLASADLSTLVGLRDRAMMEVLYATGMRRMEIAGLAVGDIDEPRALVLIRWGKGGRDRLIPLGERALHWVQRYLAEVRPRLAWDENVRALFLGQEGYALGLNQLSKRMAEYVREAGIGKTGGCHLWRHTMATLMLEGGADIRFIQAMLGHSELSTTQIYTHVAVGHLQRVHASTHPGVALRMRGEGTMLGAVSGPASLREAAPTPAPCLNPENTPEALWAALAREAEADGE